MDTLINENQTDRLMKAGQIIGYTGDRITHLIDEMSEFFKTSIGEGSIKAEEFVLADLVEHKIGTFSHIIATHGGDIAIEIPIDEKVVTSPKLLGILIHNVVDDAIKAKPANKIRIYTSELDTDLHLVISDAGPGLPAQILSSLNQKPTDPDALSGDLDNGWGIVLIKEICKLLQLRIYAYNNAGAKVHIIFGQEKYSKWKP
jgi:signal transduction histidine kinase